ncbi:MAG: VOC family protein [Paracoccaceae bacterium]|jgi:catechol 2,3-dioxygenase-like lactoylglutathione lyase family enzyme|nr:VOC family protein [Paracoccaceae bacterium]
MSFTIRRIDHVVLYVADQSRSTRFYEQVLGCTVARVNEAAGIVHLRAGDGMIDLVARPTGTEGRNVDHLALRIDPWEPERLAAHLAAHGIAPGEVRLRFGAEGVGPSLYFDDPDGNTIELKGPAEG